MVNLGITAMFNNRLLNTYVTFFQVFLCLFKYRSKYCTTNITPRSYRTVRFYYRYIPGLIQKFAWILKNSFGYMKFFQEFLFMGDYVATELPSNICIITPNCLFLSLQTTNTLTIYEININYFYLLSNIIFISRLLCYDNAILRQKPILRGGLYWLIRIN